MTGARDLVIKLVKKGDVEFTDEISLSVFNFATEEEVEVVGFVSDYLSYDEFLSLTETDEVLDFSFFIEVTE